MATEIIISKKQELEKPLGLLDLQVGEVAEILTVPDGSGLQVGMIVVRTIDRFTCLSSPDSWNIPRYSDTKVKLIRKLTLQIEY